MKYAHYDKTDGKLLGWYDNEIHADIPSPSVKVSDAAWQGAIDNGYNYVDDKTGKLGLKDFRTPEEIQAQEIEQQRSKAKQERDQALNAITHTLSDGSTYQVRPQDLANFELAIKQGQDVEWVLADNSVRLTTIDELQEILNSGIQQGVAIWDAYKAKLKEINGK